MNYDTDLAVRLISELEISDNPQSLLVSQLLRDLTLTVDQFVALLCCSCSFADGIPDTCEWKWQNEQLACTRCGQLAADWRVRAGSVLESLREPIAKPVPAPLVIEDHHEAGTLKLTSKIASQRCSGCGNLLAVTAKFCPSCGRTASRDVLCHGCKTPVTDGASFCPQCGTKVA